MKLAKQVLMLIPIIKFHRNPSSSFEMADLILSLFYALCAKDIKVLQNYRVKLSGYEFKSKQPEMRYLLILKVIKLFGCFWV
jgi:hypothetical protein